MQHKSLKSSIQVCEDIKDILIQSGIESALTGGIYIVSRPLGTAKEDVVINTIYFDADQVQTGVLNVNVHAPALTNQGANTPNSVDNIQPNIIRMNEIGALISSALDGYIGADFSLTLRDSGRLEGYKNDWYFNIEVEYEHLRIDLI